MSHSPNKVDLNRRAFLRGNWASQPFIDLRCLNFVGVYCESCKDVCSKRAIVFDSLPGKLAQPRIDSDKCGLCQDCMTVCPTQAIHINKVKEEV